MHISSEQAYVRMLAYLKLLKMTSASVLRFDESEYDIKFWSTQVRANGISNDLIQL